MLSCQCPLGLTEWNGAAINGNISPRETNCRAVKSTSWELSFISFFRKSQFLDCLSLSEETFPMCFKNRLTLDLFFILLSHSLECFYLENEAHNHQRRQVGTQIPARPAAQASWRLSSTSLFSLLLCLKQLKGGRIYMGSLFRRPQCVKESTWGDQSL